MTQITFDLNNQCTFRKADYYISGCNSEAFNLLNEWPILWGVKPYSYTILIKGPEASGKTYLANLWHQIAITNVFLHNLDHLQTVNQENYIIDDCDKWNEEELFHAFNKINSEKKYLLLTSQADWKPKLPDLVSRINSIKSVKLLPPDEEMVKILLISEFSKRSMQITSEILTFLAYRLPRNYQRIKQTVISIDQYCLTHHKKVSIYSIKEGLDL